MPLLPMTPFTPSPDPPTPSDHLASWVGFLQEENALVITSQWLYFSTNKLVA